MAAIINTNIQSLNAQRNLSSSQNSLATSMQRLSSGLRINSAKDDAAGLAISERMTTQVRGLTVAARNANDGISLAQTAEGALSSLGNNLQRIRELAVQARNATNSSEDRAALDAEVQQLKAEVTRISQQTSFNGTKLLDGSFTNMAFQVGANQGQTINISGIVDANVDKLGQWTSVAKPAGPLTADVVAGTTSATQVDGKVTTTAIPTGDHSGAPISFTVDSKPVTLNGNYAATEDIRQAVATALGSDYAVTDAAGVLTITKTGSVTAPVFTAGTGGVSGTSTPGTAAGAASFSPVSFKLNGTDITVNDSATTASERMSNLIKAINLHTDTTGVVASNDKGALKLTSAGGTGNINIALGAGTDAAALKAQAGLTAADNLATAGKGEIGFASLSVLDATDADNAILAMDAALMAVNGARASLGAVQSRFETTIENLSVTTENLSAARSRIMDADFAVETANLSRSQILQQAGTAMVAQANQLPQQVLQLLQG
ncbi:flagellin [Comamonas endophytica]|uniref:Flagellin n=1 Tax=Comamonas endophytica TaxID=2949090 RepID=A0ABY6GEJ9_9BURK|nr:MULTISPECIES: flagellin [unclassified Acidovorax]MCD2512740.1 flagellin [Acidovorax sp. D4N7]UYG52909.1 flagellin [Acidovorax sp. 5MLIR]